MGLVPIDVGISPFMCVFTNTTSGVADKDIFEFFLSDLRNFFHYSMPNVETLVIN